MLEMKNLSHSIHQKTIIESIDWTVEPGLITILLGANGAGKTTLFHILGGLYKASVGEVWFNGVNITALETPLRKKIGYLPEFPFFYEHLSVMDMLMVIGLIREVPARLMKARIEQWTILFQLEEVLDQKIHTLSQGTRKRVAIVSTLLHEPEIVLLDEPTNGLDPYQIGILKEVLQQLTAQNKIVLVSTHIVDFAEKIGNHLGVMRNGQLIFQDKKCESLEQLFFSLYRN